jgi:hypothetical protein
MNSSQESDHDSFAQRHRGGVFLEKLGIDLYPHPYLGFSLAPGHRSTTINTDDEGFRLSASPFGTVDSTIWVSAGGGGLVLGSSVAFGLGASSDSSTVASRLAFLTQRRWLNLAVLAGNSLQELIAAVPFLQTASTVVIFSGLSNYLSMLRSRTPNNVFGPIFYEGTFAKLTQIPLFDLADLASGEVRADAEGGRLARQIPPKPDLTDALARVEAAARMQLRDLAFLARTANDRTQILFCLQPLATPRTRAILPEEQEHYDFQEPLHGVPWDVLENHLDLYADRLGQGCADLGVNYLKVSADQFVGRSFVSNGVLTDEGNQQAAQLIYQALEEAGRRRKNPPLKMMQS